MVEFVEGEWKDFVFKMITKEDYPKVLQNFRQVFCKDEPILYLQQQLSGATDFEEVLTDLTNFATFVLDRNDNLSFCALDKNGNVS